MGTTPSELLAFDRDHLWHPYTSMTDPTPVRLVTGGQGAHLTIDGRDVVDGMSSWWAAIHGYRHPVLDDAVRQQVDDFSHVMFGGLTHEPAVRLGERLVEITPGGLEHVFLADSGSVSVEVALKMALQYQRGKQRPERTRMLTVYGGYHGDTFDCMSVTDPVGGMHSMWKGLLPEQVFGPQPPSVAGPEVSRLVAGAPHTSTTGTSPVEVRAPASLETSDAITAWADEMRTLAARHAHELAGLIVEPLLQGAGGMHPYPPACLQVFREIADEHDLVLIFDEIATGFGRTGHLFACEAAGVVPDVLCLGKALTGGYLTAAAVVTTTEVAHAISASESGVLMHGPTFMGNPLACAVALASIDLLLAHDWQDRVRHINQKLTQGLSPLWGTPGVVDVRTIGAVGVVQLDRPIDMVAATGAALDAGAWLRPFRDMVYTMPPYVCTDDDLDRIIDGIAAAVRAG